MLALVAPYALPQQSGPAVNIQGATWQEYSHNYPVSPLCAEDEISLWSCSTGKRNYSLCSSREVTRTQGYLQYLVSKAGKTEFTYPPTKRPPAGIFTYHSYPNGNASIEFVNNGYRYRLLDPLRSDSSISVVSPSGESTEIACSGNQTLQINYTMRLMYDSGIWDR